jgi:hypothetical protein
MRGRRAGDSSHRNTSSLCFAGRHPLLGASTSDELLGAAEIRTPAFWKSSSRAMPDDSSTSHVSGSGARFYAGACVRSGRTRRSDAWQSARPVAALVTIPIGRKHERRTTRRG